MPDTAPSKVSRSTPGTGSAADASASARTFTDISPIDERPLAEMAAGGAAEVDAAVGAAQQAFAGLGGHRPATSAPTILHRVADGIDKRAEDLAVVETRDNGSLLRSHRRSVMPRVGMNFRFFAEQLRGPVHPDLRSAVIASGSPGTRPASRRSSRRGTRR